MSETSILAITTIITSIATFSLGIVVLSRNIKSYQNIIFGVFTTLLAIWSWIIYLLKVDPSVLWGRLLFVPVPLILTAIAIFSYHFPVSKDKLLPKGWMIWIVLILDIVLCVIGVSPLVIKDVQVINGQISPIVGQLFYIYYFAMSLLALIAVVSLVIQYRRSSPENRLRVQYFVVGLVLMMITMAIFSAAIPLLTNSYALAFYSPSLTIILVVFTSFSILRYSLWGIRFVAGKVLYFILISTVGFLVFYLAADIQMLLWGNIYSPIALLTGFILAVIIVPFFLAIIPVVKRFVDSKVIYTEFSPYEVLNKLIKLNNTELDLKKLNANTLSIISDTFRLEGIGLVLFDSNSQIVDSSFVNLDGGVIQNIEEMQTLFSYWQSNKFDKEDLQVLNISEIEYLVNQGGNNTEVNSSCLALLKKYKLSLVIPIAQYKKITGMFFIGHRKDQIPFTSEDVGLLISLVNNTRLGIERALLYTQVEGFAQTLQQKVDIQTKELQEKNASLEENLRKEHDMMDILGHELRTPLSIARNEIGFIELYLKQHQEPLLDRSKIEPYISKSMENMRREVKILETILSSTKIENNRLEINLVDVDCIDVVNDTVEGLDEFAKSKNIQLTSQVPPSPLNCKADRDRIQEVLFNLTDNAIKYTKEGSVTVILEDLGNEVKFSVIDTGEGIPQEDIPNLGKKFFRSRMYLESSKEKTMQVVRPGGTGIGLYVVKGLIELMKGRLDIESEVGKGSKFMVYFPK